MYPVGQEAVEHFRRTGSHTPVLQPQPAIVASPLVFGKDEQRMQVSLDNLRNP